MISITRTELSGTVCAPPSKSAAIREYILSALAKGTSSIRNPLYCEDTITCLNALSSFGAKIEKSDTELKITGGSLHPPETILHCGNSASVMRFLACLAARFEETTYFTGDDSLCRRPMLPLFKALEELGAEIHSDNNRAPFSVTGPVKKKEVSLPADISSQFISGLLLSSQPNGITLHMTGSPVSFPYIEMTVSAMKNHGIRVEKTQDGFFVYPNQEYMPASVTLPGDYSAAAYLLAAGALCGEVTVTNLMPDTHQADEQILTILQDFGAKITRSGTSVRAVKSILHGTDINLQNAPDLFPIVCVLASQAEGTSRIFGAPHLKYKESDRIATVTSFLKSMNADITPYADGAVIRGKSQLIGQTIYTQNDHRIAMAGILAGLCAAGVSKIDKDCTSISYPGFLQDIEALKK